MLILTCLIQEPIPTIIVTEASQIKIMIATYLTNCKNLKKWKIVIFYADHIAGNVWKPNYMLALSVAEKQSSQNNIQVEKVCTETNQVCHHLIK